MKTESKETIGLVVISLLLSVRKWRRLPPGRSQYSNISVCPLAKRVGYCFTAAVLSVLPCSWATAGTVTYIYTDSQGTSLA